MMKSSREERIKMSNICKTKHLISKKRKNSKKRTDEVLIEEISGGTIMKELQNGVNSDVSSTRPLEECWYSSGSNTRLIGVYIHAEQELWESRTIANSYYDSDDDCCDHQKEYIIPHHFHWQDDYGQECVVTSVYPSSHERLISLRQDPSISLFPVSRPLGSCYGRLDCALRLNSHLQRNLVLTELVPE